MSDQPQQMQQALDFIKNGQRDQARALLEPIVRANPNDADAWWLLAMSVPTPADMQNALRNVVRINPNYPNAQAMLDQVSFQLGMTAPAAPAPATSTGSDTEIISPTNPMAATMVNTSTKPDTRATPPSGTPTAKPSASDDPFALPDNFDPGVTPSSPGKPSSNLDDIFSPPTPVPNRPTPNQSMQSTMPTPAMRQAAPPPPPMQQQPMQQQPMQQQPMQGGYVPTYPGMYGGQPQQQQRKRGGAMRTVLIILVVVFVCVCGVCVGVPLIGSVVVMNNPTLQAAAKTVGAVVGTGITFIQAPDNLPAGAQAAGTLTAGQQQSATLQTLDQQVWQYQGKSGEAVTISAKTSAQSLQMFMGLYDSNGKILKRSNGVADHTSTLTYTLPSDGTYSILVSGLGGAPGAYTIQLASGSSQ